MAEETTQPERRQRWDGIVRRSVDIELRAINDEERSVEVVASTDTIDSHGDVVEQDFVLKRYRKNPVVLWMHNAFGFLDGSRAEDFLPIGRAENVRVEDGKLLAKIYLVQDDEEGEELVAKIWRRIKQKVLRAVSIGFRPGKVTREENAETGKVTYRLAKNELFEISVVPIPSNPDAVAMKMAALERESFKALAEHSGDEPKRLAKPQTEKTMNEEELKSEIARLNGELASAKLDAANSKTGEQEAKRSLSDAQSTLKTTKASLETAEKRVADLETENKSLLDRVEQAEGEQINAEVQSLVGKKIGPSQVEGMIELRAEKGKDWFEKHTALMPDLGLTEEKTAGDNKTRVNGSASRVIQNAQKAARRATGSKE